MEKKLLTGAIASVVALTGAPSADAGPGKKKNTKEGLDNPLSDQYCSYDEDGLWTAGWYDPNDADPDGTKYGGDIEFDAWVAYECTYEAPDDMTPDGAAAFSEHAEEYTAYQEETSEAAIVDIDLGMSESDDFMYACEDHVGVVGEPAAEDPNDTDCMATITWEDVQAAADAKADERFSSSLCPSTGIEVYTDECIESSEICTATEFVCDESSGYGIVSGECAEGGEGTFVGINEAGQAICEDGADGYTAALICVDESDNFGGTYPTEECVTFESVCTDYATETVVVDGNFSTGASFDEDSGYFGVKEMNPGKGKGRQNYEKVYDTCEYAPID